MHAITIGQDAPDFALPDQHNTIVTLQSLRGSFVVLFFYPKDNTPGCTTEACEFTDTLGDFAALQARVFGVSPDSPESHLAFIEKKALRISLLSDPDHVTLEAYGAWGEKPGGRVGVIRGTVLISPNGTIVHHWPRVSPEGHAQEVHRTLAALAR